MQSVLKGVLAYHLTKINKLKCDRVVSAIYARFRNGLSICNVNFMCVRVFRPAR